MAALLDNLAVVVVGVLLAALMGAVGWQLKRLIDRNDENADERATTMRKAVDDMSKAVGTLRVDTAVLTQRVTSLERARGRSA